jgi:hypothetical protein
MESAGEPEGSQSRAPSTTPSNAESASGRSKKNKGKGRGRPRDERSFDDPQSLRGIIQALEDDRTKAMENISQMNDRINQLTGTVESQQTRLSRLEPSPNRSIPSVEVATPGPTPVVTPPPVVTTPTPFIPRNSSDYMPYQCHPQSSKLTEKIEPLDDGTSPTFRQWKISVRDRFTVNSDHYPTEITRKALVWSTTTGLSRSYLEPRYQSEDQDFDTADEMIDTLSSYFVTGLETEQDRNQFHDMRMGDKDHSNETFPEFIARFRSKAILGRVQQSDWFYHCWDKITPPLRNTAVASKHLWNHNFEQMVISLTSMDLERRRNYERAPPPNSRNTSGSTAKTGSSGGSSKYTPKPPRTGYVPKQNTFQGPAKISVDLPKLIVQTLIRPPNTLNRPCFLCSKTSHFKANCPNLPIVRAILAEINKGKEPLELEEEVEDVDLDLIRKGNDEA